MVTGRANFPSARNNKRTRLARMAKEMLEWSENARRKIIQELKGGGAYIVGRCGCNYQVAGPDRS